MELTLLFNCFLDPEKGDPNPSWTQQFDPLSLLSLKSLKMLETLGMEALINFQKTKTVIPLLSQPPVRLVFYRPDSE